MFKVSIPAKWVLCGEHSVLRGSMALAFPLKDYALTFSYQESGEPLSFDMKSLIERALTRLELPLATISGGTIKIESTIPVGAGLGSSAALCVAVARFVLEKTSYTGPCTLVSLATALEDLFHGKSSGMDVNAIAHGSPILYSIKTGAQPFFVSKMPDIKLIDSSLRGKTRDCIARVREWQIQNPDRVLFFDQQMNEATEKAKQSLEDFSLPALAASINQAHECFDAWGLITPELQQQRAGFLKQGALAAKLTGAGLGGFWAVLWPT